MNSEVDDGCERHCLVQALQVSFGYPGRLLADRVSHCWHAGLCLLQGNEGSGKTSWLKALSGQLPLKTGMLHYPLEPSGALTAASFFWQDPRQPLRDAHHRMLAADWLALQRTLYPRWSDTAFLEHVQGFSLEPHLRKPLQALSSGSQRKLWMAAGWASGASLVLMDEPLAALDKPSERYVQQALTKMRKALKNPSQPRCVMVAHWDAMNGVEWDDVMELSSLATWL